MRPNKGNRRGRGGAHAVCTLGRPHTQHQAQLYVVQGSARGYWSAGLCSGVAREASGWSLLFRSGAGPLARKKREVLQGISAVKKRTTNTKTPTRLRAPSRRRRRAPLAQAAGRPPPSSHATGVAPAPPGSRQGPAQDQKTDQKPLSGPKKPVNLKKLMIWKIIPCPVAASTMTAARNPTYGFCEFFGGF